MEKSLPKESQCAVPNKGGKKKFRKCYPENSLLLILGLSCSESPRITSSGLRVCYYYGRLHQVLDYAEHRGTYK